MAITNVEELTFNKKRKMVEGAGARKGGKSGGKKGKGVKVIEGKKQ